jgi:hypothetical protein
MPVLCPSVNHIPQSLWVLVFHHKLLHLLTHTRVCHVLVVCVQVR